MLSLTRRVWDPGIQKHKAADGGDYGVAQLLVQPSWALSLELDVKTGKEGKLMLAGAGPPEGRGYTCQPGHPRSLRSCRPHLHMVDLPQL